MNVVYSAKRHLWEKRRASGRLDARRPIVDSRVCVVMDAGIGNAVEATPLVQAIRVLWPRTHLTVVGPAGDLFDDWSVVDRTVSSRREIAGHAFHHVFATWATSPFEGAERAERLFPDWLLRPEREINMQMIRRQGYRGPTPPLHVSMREPGVLPPSPLRIAIAAGGKRVHRWRNKHWPHYERLAAALLDRYEDAQVCFLGGPEDDEPPRLPRVLDLRGALTLRESAWVLKQSDLVIGNDCGPMHIADAVLAPSLVLFGPTCEVKNGPRYRGVALNADVACSPCQYDLELLDSCADPVCMTQLSVDTVLDAAARMLERR